jgi:hypothetical protein
MKKLSTYLFLILFSFSAPSFADDIRDFQIEGMSVGDSALDYFSEEELKNASIESYEDKKFLMLGIWKEYKSYDVLQIYVKPNDSKYKIHAIAGVIVYSDNLEGCYKKKDEITNDLSANFKNLKKDDRGRLKNSVEADPYGGTYDVVIFYFIDGSVMQVSCNDWSEKSGIVDSVKVEVYSQEVVNYLKKKN